MGSCVRSEIRPLLLHAINNILAWLRLLKAEIYR